MFNDVGMFSKEIERISVASSSSDVDGKHVKFRGSGSKGRCKSVDYEFASCTSPLVSASRHGMNNVGTYHLLDYHLRRS